MTLPRLEIGVVDQTLNKDILSKEQSITDLSSTDSIPFHSLNPLPFAHGEAATPPERKRTEAKSNSAVEIYREIIKDNIEYDHLIQNCKIDKDRLDEIVDLMLETVCTPKDNPYCRGRLPRRIGEIQVFEAEQQPY